MTTSRIPLVSTEGYAVGNLGRNVGQPCRYLCSRVPSQTLTVQNGTVRGGSGVSVSGQVEPSGSISLALQKSGVRGSASGTLSGVSGSGTWTAPSLGCSGRWTAQRRSTVTAQAN
jgi:hypothetical protein